MRADVYLSENGWVTSRQRAKVLIEEGNVWIDGVPVSKPSQAISDGEHAVRIQNDLPYVSRGGLKLEAALQAFHISPKGAIAIDIGASTGGFTDCLLQGGAEKIFAVDSGEGQLVASLRNDPRVVSMERTNARTLTLEQIGGVFADLIVMDVSFISATYLIPIFHALLKENAHAVCLIKPQFEVGRAMLGKGGIVKDAKAHRMAVEKVLDASIASGLTPVALIPSPISGGDGNREFLVYFINNPDGKGCLTASRITEVTGAVSHWRKEGS